jgi:hypothetical protein
VAESIRGDELRSLICELRGDVEPAIKYRQSELRRIFEQHSSVHGTPGWNYVFGEYDYRGISDRIDLLAGLYASMDDNRAVSSGFHDLFMRDSRAVPCRLGQSPPSTLRESVGDLSMSRCAWSSNPARFHTSVSGGVPCPGERAERLSR